MRWAIEMERFTSGPTQKAPVVSVVEDDPAMRAALTDLLDSAGCSTRAFASGEQFMSSDAPSTSDVVITDIQLAKLNGLEIVRRLREMTSSPPVIVITALTDEQLERRAIEDGCYAFLRKPFNANALLQHVRSAADPGRN